MLTTGHVAHFADEHRRSPTPRVRRAACPASPPQTKGKIKQAAGDLTGDKKLQRDGKADQVTGKVKSVMSKVKSAKEATKNDTNGSDCPK